jgi:AraC-like DNA-binding protein
MPSVPLPFIVALVLLVLLGQLLGRRDEHDSANRLAMALIGVYALQSVIIGLRWGYGVKALLPLQSTLAAVLAALAWLCFRGLSCGDVFRRPVRTWVHAFPALLVISLVILWPDGIDLVLVVVFLGYGIALVRLALQGPDALGRTSFEGVVPTYGALWTTAAALILSALLEAFVLVDMIWAQGTRAALAVGFANLLALLVLGGAATVAGRSTARSQPALGSAPSLAPDAADSAVMVRLDELMKAKSLFLDLDLSLDRLARRTLIPARQISAAVNRVAGKNVSQYINEYRVAEACRLLAETDEAVTSVMFKSGFQTKSNFNREFLRVTGVSPSEWRAKRGAAPPAELCPAPQGPA